MRNAKIRIRRAGWSKSPNSQWVVEGLRGENGKRIRKFFPSRDAAQDWLIEKRPELKAHGRSALVLTDAQRVDAVRALAVLAPLGATLTAAAIEFAERAKLLSRTVSIQQLHDETIGAKTADGASHAYLLDLSRRLRAFARDFGPRPVATIETQEIDDWLRALDLSPVSRNNFRRNLGVAFSFAVGRGYAQANPVSRTAEAKEVRGAPGVLRPGEMAALLEIAEPALVPVIAIAGFAGLRETEIQRLDWGDVSLTERLIRIDAGKAKTTSRRIAPISDNLAAWLAPYARASGEVRVSGYHRRLAVARKAATAALAQTNKPAPGLIKWPPNALRHSFVSYRLVTVANSAQVALEAGHSVAVLHRHYKALVTPTEGAAWFSIVPPAEPSAVIPFAAASA